MTALTYSDVQPGWLIAPLGGDGEPLAPQEPLGDDRTVTWNMRHTSSWWKCHEVTVESPDGRRTCRLTLNTLVVGSPNMPVQAFTLTIAA